MLNQRNSPKLLVGIAGGLVLLIVLFLAYQWLFSSNPQPVKAPETAVSTKPAVIAEQPAAESFIATDPDTIQLVNEDLLNAAVPQDQSLAKEEVAKLEDIQTQLNDQQQMLSTQHSQADELIRLKEEQIQLLEAQLKAAP
ncbi:hypothetical protein SE27_00165 [Acinetobacter harbinensis]|uniref:hypothetical protein n=1 Tax=Acinetobacter harbinensis TaxID=1353941 RepID=UPI00057CC504|nr:hypothetical protein [Acinetobacter harbinensis]KWQ03810.1 hypothetical protein SE27_00165 [Acinetobacter harbinensis]